MILLSPDQAATLRDWFLPERPGPLVGPHVLQTGNGSFHVDRWPNPSAVLIETGGNYCLVGHPKAVEPDDLKNRVSGLVSAAEPFSKLLGDTFDDLSVWQRVILDLPESPRRASPRNHEVRKIGPSDAYHLRGLSRDIAWIYDTWGGPAGLAGSRHAWGAFANGQLVSIACSFFVGFNYEDVGVVTEPEFRGRGLAEASARAGCQEIRRRGRTPTWAAGSENSASLRVAEKLGFLVRRQDVLYVVGRPIPESHTTR